MLQADLHSGDLLYWRGKGFYAWLVRTWTRSPYAHVAVYWRNGDRSFFLDSLPGRGVQAIALEDDPPTWAQHTHSAWSPLVHQKAVFKVGQPYSFLDAVRSAFGLPAKARGYMCAEFAVYVLECAGWNFYGMNPTPARLAAMIAKSAGYPVEVFG